LSAAKRLIVNADDFGFTRDVNRGIIEAHRAGILTATTLMANGAAFEDAVKLARETPSLDVGAHLTLVGGPGQPPTVTALLAAMARGRVRVYDEFAAQVSRIMDAGIAPTHLDTHKHTHVLPNVLNGVLRVAHEFQVPWVRAPFDQRAAGRSWKARSIALLEARFRRQLAASGCRATDQFAGFDMTGRFGAADLAALVARLPDGVTEFMCHPGYCTGELHAARTRLKESRERELQALTSSEVRESLARSGVELIGYRALAR
jgi:chitin disaccharide deacetylase